MWRGADSDGGTQRSATRPQATPPHNTHLHRPDEQHVVVRAAGQVMPVVAKLHRIHGHVVAHQRVDARPLLGVPHFGGVVVGRAVGKEQRGQTGKVGWPAVKRGRSHHVTRRPRRTLLARGGARSLCRCSRPATRFCCRVAACAGTLPGPSSRSGCKKRGLRTGWRT